MIRFFVYTDINLFISHNKAEIQNTKNNITESSKKAYFLYAYSIFESTITEILKYYLNAFPEKLDKNITIEKNELLSSPLTYDLISNCTNAYIRKLSSKTLSQYLHFLKETLSIDFSFDDDIINEISKIRNNITHNNSASVLEQMHILHYKVLPMISLSNIETYINILIDVLDSINNQICEVYSKYNYEFLLRSIWSYAFSTPVLAFDQIWNFKNNTLQINDINQVKLRVNSISSSEHLLISIFFQQYNNNLNELFHSFKDIPALVSIDDNWKNKIIEIINFFKYYPHIFNGESVKHDI